jgi:hypothetical protein
MFWPVRPLTHVRRLALTPFYEVAYDHRWIGRRWFLTSVDGGFEISRGGVGLLSRWFSVFTT